MGAKCPGNKCECESICVTSKTPSQVVLTDADAEKPAPIDDTMGSAQFQKMLNEPSTSQGHVEPVHRDPIKILEWHAKLRKSAGEAFGLAHMPAKDGASVLIVAKYVNGPVSEWNMDCQSKGTPEHMIQVGDRIVKVNDCEGPVRALQAALMTDEVSIRLQRYPETFELKFVKTQKDALCGMRLEMRSKPETTQRVLVVAEVQKNGMLERWNKECAQKREYHFAVTVHTEVQSVCGITGDYEAMRQSLKDRIEVPIVFRRHAVQLPWSHISPPTIPEEK